MGTRAAATAAAIVLILLSASAHGQAVQEMSILVGIAEKLTVVAFLVIAIWLAGKEILRLRAVAHALRNQLGNVHLAREMWKTAYFRTCNPNDPDMKTMLDREEGLLKMLEAA